MPLTPQKTKKSQGLLINEYKVNEDSFTKPIEINVKFFKEVRVGSFTSQAEFMTRRVLYDNLPPPQYFVDNIGVWKLKELNKQTEIIICGEKGKRNSIKLLKIICEEHNLNLNQINLYFNDIDFIKTLWEKMEHSNNSFDDLIDLPQDTKTPPRVILKTFTKGQWQNPQIGFPIEQISLKITSSDFTYRIYSKNQWLNWTQNGGTTGIQGYPIKGFQFNFKNDDYRLLYRCHFTDDSYSQWRDASINNHFNRIIDNFEFKIEKIQ